MMLRLQIPNQRFEHRKGFTLIELFVVLTIFMLIIGTAVSIFISVVQHQKKVLEGEELLNQTSYVSEYLSRAIRMALQDDTGSCLGSDHIGYDYLLTHFDNVSGFYQGIKFLANDGTCEEFFYQGTLQEQKNGGTSQNILSDKFQVTSARFIINGDKTLSGASQADLIQPRVTFLLDVKTTGPNVQEKVIQTTISQRNLNTSQ